MGSFYTGTFPHLIFAMDHDVANPTGESVFSNISITTPTPPDSDGDGVSDALDQCPDTPRARRWTPTAARHQLDSDGAAERRRRRVEASRVNGARRTGLRCVDLRRQPGREVARTELLDGGATLRMVGNTWKKVMLNCVVGPDTFLSFDFASSCPRRGARYRLRH